MSASLALECRVKRTTARRFYDRYLAPMRKRENLRTVAEGIEAIQREEAAYWLGMAMNCKRPRRVLAALRMLLTESKAERTSTRAVTRDVHFPTIPEYPTALPTRRSLAVAPL